MGYAHGTQWNDELIEESIKEVVQKAKINTFPTRSLIKEVTGSSGLSNAIRRHGGTKYWAEKLGLEIKPCESKLGEKYELLCMSLLQEIGFKCEKMPVRYPYDILVEDSVKVEVKCGNIYHGKTGDFYTFNLEKVNPTCDIFVCYCLENDEVKKEYVIPSSVLSGKTQLSIGKNYSRLDKFKNDWRPFVSYVNFHSIFSDPIKRGY